MQSITAWHLLDEEFAVTITSENKIFQNKHNIFIYFSLKGRVI